MTRLTNAFTVDFEDWYHGLEIPPEGWKGFEDRIERGAGRLLELLEAMRVRGTFFILGAIAEKHPRLVREIAAAGHEIGTHGWSHTMVYRMTPEDFRAELKRSIDVLADLSGQRILGHRAPFFSITRQSLWALEILAQCGIRYDSSVFPVLNYRYGIEDAPRWPYQVENCTGQRTITACCPASQRSAARSAASSAAGSSPAMKPMAPIGRPSTIWRRSMLATRRASGRPWRVAT